MPSPKRTFLATKSTGAVEQFGVPSNTKSCIRGFNASPLFAEDTMRRAMRTKEQIVAIDVCCGSRMFWEDKNHPGVVFIDTRQLITTICDKRKLIIEPDILADARELPFPDEVTYHIALDPPHLIQIGDTAWMALKYGKLDKETWKEDIKAIFCEAWRVLKPGGTLNFKWSQKDIRWSEVEKILPIKRAYGDDKRQAGKIWSAFLKPIKTRELTKGQKEVQGEIIKELYPILTEEQGEQ